MQPINLDEIQNKLSQTSSQTHNQHSTTSDEQKQRATVYFFKRAHDIYLSKFVHSFPNEDVLKAARREWVHDIGVMSREQIDNGFVKIKAFYARGDDDFKWPNIGAMLGVCKGTYIDKSNLDESGNDAAWQQRSIQEADRRRMIAKKANLLPDKTAREKTEAAKADAMNAIKGMKW